MVYLVLVGGIQFVYCVVVGNYVRSCPHSLFVGDVMLMLYVGVAIQCLPSRLLSCRRPVRAYC
jgi:hypothetical protein